MIDLLSLNDGSVESIVTGDSIPSRTYLGIVLHLDETTQGEVIDSEGNTIPLYVKNKVKYILVDESVTIEKNETFDINLHFDLRQSVSYVEQDGEAFYLMDPVVTPLETAKSSSLEITTSGITNAIACLYTTEDIFEEYDTEEEADGFYLRKRETYLKSLNREPNPFDGRFRPPAEDERISSTRPNKRQRRPLASGETHPICEDAVASAKIVDSKGGFYYIESGSYELRLFNIDGDIYDYDETIVLSEGDRVSLEDIELELIYDD